MSDHAETDPILKKIINDDAENLGEISEEDANYRTHYSPACKDIPEELSFQAPILAVATYFHAMKCFDALLAKGSKIEANDYLFRTLIHFIVMKGHFDLLEDQRFAECDFNKEDWKGQTPIHYCAVYNRLEMLKYLHQNKGIDINITDSCGDTPLSLACKFGSSTIIEYLLQNQAEEKSNDFGKTPFFQAIEGYHVDAVQKYLELRPDALQEKYKLNMTPLHVIAKLGISDLIPQFTVIGINKVDDIGYTPLHYAVDYEKIDCIQTILKVEGVNAYVADNKGRMPIHIAATKVGTDILKRILEQDEGLINLPDLNGRTPLHWCVIADKPWALITLLHRKAITNVKDVFGKVPADYAVGCYRNELFFGLTRRIKKIPKPKEEKECVYQEMPKDKENCNVF